MDYLESEPEVQRVRYEVRRFRQHLITYIAVVGVLFLVNVLSGGFWYGHWWFLWVALIWGVFLALQAAHLFGDHFGHAWEDRMVDQVLANRRRRTAEASAPRPSYTAPQAPRPPSASPPPTTTSAAAPTPEGPSPEVRQEPIVMPPPSANVDVRQEPIITPPPGSAPAGAPFEPKSGSPKPPEV